MLINFRKIIMNVLDLIQPTLMQQAKLQQNVSFYPTGNRLKLVVLIILAKYI